MNIDILEGQGADKDRLTSKKRKILLMYAYPGEEI